MPCSDQNQRMLSGPPRCLIDAPHGPPAAVDGEVLPVLVDPGAEAGRAKALRGHY